MGIAFSYKDSPLGRTKAALAAIFVREIARIPTVFPPFSRENSH
jgi:hypothetical protein